jgi:hypothetical protein
MSLFDQILGAIDNPSKQASSGQLSSIINAVQQLSQETHADPSTIQSLVAIVGKYARPALQQKREAEGNEQTQSFVNQFSGTQPSSQAVNMLFSHPQVEQLVQEAEQRTGLQSGTIQSLLPVVVPLVLNFLQTGTDKENPQGSNSVLESFLDSDRDGDVDIADAMHLAQRHFNL